MNQIRTTLGKCFGKTKLSDYFHQEDIESFSKETNKSRTYGMSEKDEVLNRV